MIYLSFLKSTSSSIFKLSSLSYTTKHTKRGLNSQIHIHRQQKPRIIFSTQAYKTHQVSSSTSARCDLQMLHSSTVILQHFSHQCDSPHPGTDPRSHPLEGPVSSVQSGRSSHNEAGCLVSDKLLSLSYICCLSVTQAAVFKRKYQTATEMKVGTSRISTFQQTPCRNQKKMKC